VTTAHALPDDLVARLLPPVLDDVVMLSAPLPVDVVHQPRDAMVSILIFSPVVTNSGTCTSAPVSTASQALAEELRAHGAPPQPGRAGTGQHLLRELAPTVLADPTTAMRPARLARCTDGPHGVSIQLSLSCRQ
jgi:hypothetical protein